MNVKLLAEALVKFILGAAITAALVFLPAGTLNFWQGWLLMAILFLPMLAGGLLLLFRAPALLKKRLHAREAQAQQRTVIALSALMFLVGFVLAGLDHRFGWFPLPKIISITAALLLLVAYLVYGEVLRENAFLSRTVEIQEGQTVIDTGLYGVVRHPMYSAVTVLFLAMPLVLGSAIAFCVFLPYPLLLAKRIHNEEQVLEQGLPGYRDYETRVRWRMFPGMY